MPNVLPNALTGLAREPGGGLARWFSCAAGSGETEVDSDGVWVDSMFYSYNITA
jgi:hypothetical protein